MITTQRLQLRPFSKEDALALYLLNLDEQVIRYTGDPPFRSEEDALDFIRSYDHYDKYGHGRYAVIRTYDGAFLGWCGLKWNEDIQEADLGYRFMRNHWGKGYAQEAGTACLKEAFDRFDYTSVIGRVMCPNISSIRVLQRLGFSFERYIYCGSSISEQWRIEKK